MVFSNTFNNISVISWQSVLWMEETRSKPPTCHKSLTNLSHTVASSTPRHVRDSLIAYVVVNGTTIRSSRP